MCTIIVRQKMDDWCSTVIASNRDEFYSRHASPPVVLSSDPLVVGGRDETKGGTWFGMTDTGLYVGLTNQRTFSFPDYSLRSRGELVLEALKTGSHDGVRGYLEQIDPRLYNEFNVIFGDGDSVAVAYGRWSSDRLELESLSAGVHVLCNDRLGSAEFPKADSTRARVLLLGPQPWPVLKEDLTAILSDTSLPDPSEVPPLPPNPIFDQKLARRLQAVCVTTPLYGTVSSTIAAVKPGEVVEYQYAAGSPSESPFKDVVHLIRGPV
ncbi:MAG: NRDE family protein [Myxococcales bacterium]|nr:NRDE family protein [Myxococcales bacterium]